MALTDRQRHDAYEALAEAFADRTDLVIEMLRSAFGAQTRTLLISLISALVLIVATNAFAILAG